MTATSSPGDDGIRKSVTAPAGVMRATPPDSRVVILVLIENQTLPSGPAAIPELASIDSNSSTLLKTVPPPLGGMRAM